jgi:hypothetical protein
VPLPPVGLDTLLNSLVSFPPASLEPAGLVESSGGTFVLSVSPVLLPVEADDPPAWLSVGPPAVDLSSSSVALPFALASGVGWAGASNNVISKCLQRVLS